jgi:hypothetical protein
MWFSIDKDHSFIHYFKDNSIKIESRGFQLILRGRNDLPIIWWQEFFQASKNLNHFDTSWYLPPRVGLVYYQVPHNIFIDIFLLSQNSSSCWIFIIWIPNCGYFKHENQKMWKGNCTGKQNEGASPQHMFLLLKGGGYNLGGFSQGLMPQISQWKISLVIS